MGCSTSAHTTPDGKPQVESDATDPETENVKALQIIDLEVTKKNALPVCDNKDQVEVDTQLESSMDRLNSSNNLTKDVETETIENSNEDMESMSQEVEERLSRLEEVVEKVVELYIGENNQNSNSHVELNANEHKGIDEVEIAKENAANNDQTEVESAEQGESSPSHSERAGAAGAAGAPATRWEALADIAAELPPSLAVDPLTGQIYTLTK